MKRDLALDGLRGIAILAVVLYHASDFPRATTTPDRMLVALPRMGWAGVDLFFVLSGFLITRILLGGKGKRGAMLGFYGRRVLRIFPLYYFVLLLFLVVLPLVPALAASNHLWLPGAERGTGWYWFYLSNLHVAETGRFHHRFLSITWSLAIEEHFYLLWPWCVQALRANALLALCGAIVGLALVLRIVWLESGGSVLGAYVLTPLRIDTLAMGAAIAIVARESTGWERLRNVSRWLLPGAAIGVGLLAVTLRLDPALVMGRPGATLLAQPPMQTVGYTLLGLLFSALLVDSMTTRRSWTRWLEGRSLRTLGKYSYAIYLIHVPVVYATHRIVFTPLAGQWPFLLEQLVRYAVALGGSLAIAWVSWRVIEAPAQRLRRFLPDG